MSFDKWWSDFAKQSWSMGTQDVARAAFEAGQTNWLPRINLLRAWLLWFRRSNDGTMADKTDVQYMTLLAEWIREGERLAQDTENGLPRN